MKKIAALCFIVSLFLLSCQTTRNEVPKKADKETVDKETVDKETIDIETADTETTAANDGWMDLYFEVIEKSAAKMKHITLIDIDLDEIPELFLSQMGSNSSSIYQGYSFKDGGVSELVISDEAMPPELELYKNKETGRTIWLANGMFRGGSVYEYIWNKVDFEDFSNISQSLFWGWEEDLEGEILQGETIYKLLGEETDDQKVTKELIDQLENEVFSDYERVDTLSLFSFKDALRKEKEDIEYDRELFYSFAGLYETTLKENAEADDDAPQQLPIYSIVNFDLLHMYEQMPEYPVSIVRKEYIRTDEENTDIFVSFAEINLFPNPQIQMEMNRRIREEALDDWDVKKEKNIELSISQFPSFYRDFLSIRTLTNSYWIDSVHPSSSLSALTFNIRTGQKLELTDILTIDDSLWEKISGGAFKNEKFTHEQCLEYGIYDKLWGVLDAEDSNLKPNFYLTEYGRLGVIMGVNHMMGDYLTFEASLEDLEGFN